MELTLTMGRNTGGEKISLFARVLTVLKDYILMSDLSKFKIYCLVSACVVSLHFASNSMSTTVGLP